MVARLTPDQKAACSSHVGVNFFYKFTVLPKETAVTRIRTWVTAATTQGPNH